MEQYCREPFSAAVLGAAATVAYIYGKAKMNNEGVLKNSEYFKPAFLVGLLIYFIVSQGQGSQEPMSQEPF
jgi:uncharacterized membrane protein YphA (DoxX/SURF4 family)